jgi:hypothetical protein
MWSYSSLHSNGRLGLCPRAASYFSFLLLTCLVVMLGTKASLLTLLIIFPPMCLLSIHLPGYTGLVARDVGFILIIFIDV